MISRFSIALAVAAALALANQGRAELFILQNDGQVRGELLNPDESPRKTYVVKTAAGEVSLDKAQVKKVVRESKEELEYLRIRADYPDTVEGQWKLAEWCHENRLEKLRKQHMERVIELDPEHALARRALGYSKIQGKWSTLEERKLAAGYVRYKDTWVLPQDRELREKELKTDLAQKDWLKKLKRLRQWMARDRQAEAETEIAAITDPYAVKGLVIYFNQERDRSIRMLYLNALARIGGPDALETLAAASIHDGDEEVRAVSLDRIVEANYSPAVKRYLKDLHSKENAVVNRAGNGLRRMKDTSTIGPLIDALITTHEYQVASTAKPGQINSTFSSGGGGGGGGGFSFGGAPPPIEKRRLPNREVLGALLEMTGKNFDFDVQAWRHWHAAEVKAKIKDIDPRRDGGGS